MPVFQPMSKRPHPVGSFKFGKLADAPTIRLRHVAAAEEIKRTQPPRFADIASIYYHSGSLPPYSQSGGSVLALASCPLFLDLLIGLLIVRPLHGLVLNLLVRLRMAIGLCIVHPLQGLVVDLLVRLLVRLRAAIGLLIVRLLQDPVPKILVRLRPAMSLFEVHQQTRLTCVYSFP